MIIAVIYATFVVAKRKPENSKRLVVKQTKVATTYGCQISKDTTVIKSNVTVSFLCLLAAPWCGWRAPQQNLTAIEVYETKITNGHKQLTCMIAVRKNYVISLSWRTSDADTIAANTQTTAIATPQPHLLMTRFLNGRSVVCAAVKKS